MANAAMSGAALEFARSVQSGDDGEEWSGQRLTVWQIYRSCLHTREASLRAMRQGRHQRGATAVL